MPTFRGENVDELYISYAEHVAYAEYIFYENITRRT